MSWSDETVGPGPQKHAHDAKRPGDKTAPTAVMIWKPKRTVSRPSTDTAFLVPFCGTSGANMFSGA